MAVCAHLRPAMDVDQRRHPLPCLVALGST